MKLNQTLPGRVLTRVLLAKHFRVSVRTVDRWGIARTELLTQKEAADRLGVSLMTFWRKSREPNFPKPIRIGGPRWRADQLDAWQAKRNQLKRNQLLLPLS